MAVIVDTARDVGYLRRHRERGNVRHQKDMSRGPSDSTDAARRQGLRRVPGDPGRPLVGYTFDFLRDQLGWARSRHARDTDVLGYFIPGGALVTVNSGLTHRLEEYWSNPAGFDPERFSP